MLPAVLACLLVAALADPDPVSAWGKEAHDVACRIAWHEMSPAGRRFAGQTLSLDSAAAFAAACSWADSVRGRAGYGWLEPQHYINVPRGGRLTPERDCLGDGCLLRAIGQQARFAVDPQVTTARRAEALKLLAHFVGDLHQPLHVSYGDDAGGNRIDVRFCPRSCWKSTDNLHQVWDRGLLDAATSLSAKDVAEDLGDAITPAQRKAWRKGDLTAWAHESFALATDVAYRPVKSGELSVGYIGDLTEPVRLDAAYVAVMRPTVMRQLQKAGVRLALALDALAKGQAPPWLTTVRARRVEPSKRAGRYADVRAVAKATSPPIGRLQIGEPLELIGREGRWYRVRLDDGREGYVRTDSARVR